MSSKANDAIKESLWLLLQDYPLSKITVKDIVTRCNINRNTFYYHFESIPALAEEIVEELIDQTIKKYPTIDSFEECIHVSIDFIVKNKKAVYHIYNSADRSNFENHLLKICYYAVFTYINRTFKDSNIDLKAKKHIIDYLKCELFGQIISWLQNGLKSDEEETFHAFCMISKSLMDTLFVKKQY